MSEIKSKPVYERSDQQTPFIEFEFRDGTSESLPYINLRQIHFEAGSERSRAERLLIYFDQGFVEVTGENLTKLKTFIKLNILEILRIGISHDLNDPAVKTIVFSASTKFGGHEREK